MIHERVGPTRIPIFRKPTLSSQGLVDKLKNFSYISPPQNRKFTVFEEKKTCGPTY